MTKELVKLNQGNQMQVGQWADSIISAGEEAEWQGWNKQNQIGKQRCKQLKTEYKTRQK